MCSYISISLHSKILLMMTARWKDGAQNLGNVRINKKECMLWNPVRSSLCTGTSSPTWGCYRSDVLAWVKLQLLNDKSPNGVQRGTLLALAKMILLVDICAVIFWYLSIPKSCLWRLLDGKMELKTWESYVSIKKNVCCGIPYGHRSAPVLHLLRGGVTGVMCWHGSNFNF